MVRGKRLAISLWLLALGYKTELCKCEKGCHSESARGGRRISGRGLILYLQKKHNFEVLVKISFALLFVEFIYFAFSFFIEDVNKISLF